MLKDLPKNSSNRFEKINTRMNFQKNTLYLVYLVSSCFLCGYFPDLSDFLYPEFPRSTLILSLGSLRSMAVLVGRAK